MEPYAYAIVIQAEERLRYTRSISEYHLNEAHPRIIQARRHWTVRGLTDRYDWLTHKTSESSLAFSGGRGCRRLQDRRAVSLDLS